MMRKRRRDENTRRKHVQFLNAEERERGEKGCWDQLEIVGMQKRLHFEACHLCYVYTVFYCRQCSHFSRGRMPDATPPISLHGAQPDH